MAKADRGSKHQCLKCGTKYYDLNRDPIVCPNCGAPYVPAAVIAAEKAKAKAKPEAAAAAVADDDVVEVDADTAAAEVGAEVVSLEDAEAVVTGKSDDDDDDDDDDIPEVADVEEVDDIGGEVDNSFIEDDDDDDDDDIGLDVSRDDDD